MLAVVHEEEAVPEPEMRDEGLEQGTIGDRRDAERGGDRGGDECGVRQRSQIDPDDAIGEVLTDIVRDGQG